MILLRDLLEVSDSDYSRLEDGTSYVLLTTRGVIETM